MSFDEMDVYSAWMPTVEYSLATFTHILLRYFLPASFVLAFIPLPPSLYVGNRGTSFLTPIAPVILFIASGLVCVIWGILVLLLTVCGNISSLLLGGYVIQFLHCVMK
jgi:glycosylphosphatidylinositol deacylase